MAENQSVAVGMLIKINEDLGCIHMSTSNDYRIKENNVGGIHCKRGTTGIIIHIVDGTDQSYGDIISIRYPYAVLVTIKSDGQILSGTIRLALREFDIITGV